MLRFGFRAESETARTERAFCDGFHLSPKGRKSKSASGRSSVSAKFQFAIDKVTRSSDLRAQGRLDGTIEGVAGFGRLLAALRCHVVIALLDEVGEALAEHAALGELLIEIGLSLRLVHLSHIAGQVVVLQRLKFLPTGGNVCDQVAAAGYGLRWAATPALRQVADHVGRR